uniref:Uncharacterized protein n=1 Tax=Sander lucioperca TaxID=283035 RepID=A0A8D0AKM5_SANLU
MILPGGGCRDYMGSDSYSLFQTQAAQNVLQSREGLVMPRMAILLGFMGIGMSGYSSRQLTLNCKPSSTPSFRRTASITSHQRQLQLRESTQLYFTLDSGFDTMSFSFSDISLLCVSMTKHERSKYRIAPNLFGCAQCLKMHRENTVQAET